MYKLRTKFLCHLRMKSKTHRLTCISCCQDEILWQKQLLQRKFICLVLLKGCFPFWWEWGLGSWLRIYGLGSGRLAGVGYLQSGSGERTGSGARLYSLNRPFLQQGLLSKLPQHLQTAPELGGQEFNPVSLWRTFYIRTIINTSCTIWKHILSIAVSWTLLKISLYSSDISVTIFVEI